MAALFKGHPCLEGAGWLAEEAMGFLENSHASSTSRTYRSAMNQFRSFAAIFSTTSWVICWQDPTPLDLVLFMTWIIVFVQVSSLHVYLYAIRNAVMRQGRPDPLRHYMVEMAWRGIKRALKPRRDNRMALTVPMLKAIAAKLVGTCSPETADLDHDLIVLMAIMVIGVFGLFRVGELVVSGSGSRVLWRRQVQVKLEAGVRVLVISLEASKTDPFRFGVDVRLGEQQEARICPLAWHRAYEASTVRHGISIADGKAFFRWKDGKRVTRQAFVDRARALVARAGYQAHKFNGISLRKEAQLVCRWPVLGNWLSCVLAVGALGVSLGTWRLPLRCYCESRRRWAASKTD